ncbi:MAG: S-layer homology domain-containing protein, partial [Clostridia bacterium]|nr:S-layer homology domain-containing protein [Clostridia bacterium]
MKRPISFLLAVLTAAAFFAAAAVPALAENAPFVDVAKDRWSRGAIEYVFSRGVMRGVGGGRFDPVGTTTRAMVVTVLWRAEGEPEPAAPSGFSDVPANAWFADAVAWAKSKGVVNGVSETVFDPNGNITREQLAAILFRFCDAKNLFVDEPGDLSGFADRGKISSYAQEAVSWAVGAGLIGGVAKDRLEPRGFATREQVATILMRFDTTEFTPLADFYRPYVDRIAEYSEEMLRGETARLGADPNSTLADLHVWGNGLILMGLAELGRYEAVEEYADTWLGHHDRNGAVSADSGLAGFAMLEMYERTGEEKYLTLAREALVGILERPTDAYGEIKYDRNENTDVFVDGTGMVTPLLARWGAEFGDADVREKAVLQVRNYLKMGVIPKYHYAYHGYNRGGVFQGEMGWGRGTGYLMLAIGSVMRYCGDEEINAKCEEFVEYTFRRLKPENKFGWTLSDPDADSDTSATGKIMWGVMMAKQAG